MLVGSAGGHTVRLAFDPPFPDLNEPSNVGSSTGTWSATIDGTPIVGGAWQVRPGDGEVRVDLEVVDGWQPNGLPLLMSVVTRVAPVFRSWPTTYRWTALVVHGDPPTMTSQWSRIDGDRGESYRSFTRSN